MWSYLYLGSFALVTVIGVGEDFIQSVEENIKLAKGSFEDIHDLSEIENTFAYGNKFGFDDEIVEIKQGAVEEEKAIIKDRKETFDDGYDAEYSYYGEEADKNENEIFPLRPFQSSKLPTFPGGSSKSKYITDNNSSNDKRVIQRQNWSPDVFKKPRRPQLENIVTDRMTLDDWNNQLPFTNDNVNKPLKPWDEKVIKIAIGKKHTPGEKGEYDVLPDVWDYDRIEEEKRKQEYIETNEYEQMMDNKIKFEDQTLDTVDQDIKTDIPKEQNEITDKTEDILELKPLYYENEKSKNNNDDNSGNEALKLEIETPMQEDWNELFNMQDNFWEMKLEPTPETTESIITVPDIKDEKINQYPTIGSTLTKKNEEPGKIKQFVAKICQISQSVGILKLCNSKRLVKTRNKSNNSRVASEQYKNKSQKVKSFKDVIEEKRRKMREKSPNRQQYSSLHKDLSVKTETSLFGDFKSAISGIFSVGNLFSSEPSPVPNRRRKYQPKRRVYKKQRDERILPN